jgi:hypothetical protein
MERDIGHSERSERSNQTGSRAPLSERASERPASATASASQCHAGRERARKDSGFQSAIRARDVRAADLQKKPTKHI